MNDAPPGRWAHWLHPQLPKKPWQIALLGLFGLMTIAVVAVALFALILLPTLPAVERLSDTRLKVPLRVYASQGELIAEFGEEKRIPIKVADVPQDMLRAILAAEDHSFYQHHGVDFLGIVRAAWHNFRTGTPSQGASTITMQVARNYFLSPEKTYTRKFREMLLAFKIERELSKEEILELYVNKIFLGHRAYGFAAAAQIYYGKKLGELSLPQMAMLAGLPKAPSRDNPLTNAEGALERRNYVLRHMQRLGYIDEETLTAALNAPLTASRHAFKYDVEAPYIAEMVRQYMMERYDEKAYAGGFDVYTTIDAAKQRAALAALRRGLFTYDRRHGFRGPVGHVTLAAEGEPAQLDDVLKDYRVVGGLVPAVVLRVQEKAATVYTQDGFTVEIEWRGLSWAKRQIDENNAGATPKRAADVARRGDVIYVQYVEAEEPAEGEPPPEQPPQGFWRLAQIPAVSGALVSLRPKDGAILALVGGFDFYQSNFNRVIQAQRQPGSSFKPFIYSAALAKGFTPATTVNGAPIVIADATLEDEWRPENYSRKFFGMTRLRKALALSLNTVSVRLLSGIGPAYATEYIQRFGFSAQALPQELALALGTASVTPIDLTRAFTVFANGGFRIEPYFIARIEDAERNVLERANPMLVCAKCPHDQVPDLTKGPEATAQDAPVSQPTTAKAPPKPTTLLSVDAKAAGKEGAPPVAVEPPTPHYAPRVLHPEIAFLMSSMLTDVIREGTGRAALELARKDLAGKTGTTNDYHDAWFVGFNGDIVATVWVGFDQPASLGRGEAGSRAALPIWIEFMRAALAGTPETVREVPANIVKRWINSETGEPTDETDPLAMEEYFMVESSPAPVEGKTAAPSITPAPTPDQPVPDKIRENLF